MTAEIGSKALIPYPALRSFNRLAGERQATGFHPAIPGTTHYGRASFHWHEGGAFLVMHTEIVHHILKYRKIKKPGFTRAVSFV